MYRTLIAALTLALTACGAKSTFQRPGDIFNPSATAYPFHYGSPYIDMFYRCTTPAGGGISIDGYTVTSPNQNLPPQNFQVTLSAWDAEGHKLTQHFTYGDDLAPDQFDPVPFEISLPAVAGAVEYDLYYDFYVADRGSGKLEEFGTVKNVCGGEYRRKAEPAGS